MSDASTDSPPDRPPRLVLDTSTADLHPALATALSFPDWYGANLDALADLLHDPTYAPAPGTRLLWRGWRRLRDEHPHRYRAAHRLLAAAVDLELDPAG